MLKKSVKKAQLAIIIIVAIFIVAGVALFFILRSGGAEKINPEFSQVYTYYQSCIEQETIAAIDLAETQGGYVYAPDYAPGSSFSPTGNQLDFFGFPVSYWYYISANGVAKEQIPIKSEIENQIASYIKERLSTCDFESFYLQGIEISFEEPEVKVNIAESEVNVEVDNPISVSKEEDSALKDKYILDVESKLGKFYNMAIDIYNKEKKESFLENYTIDILRLNAPVDGVEIGCSPKIWKSREVVDDLSSALESNIAAIKFSGDYYDLNKKEDKYFVINEKVDEQVNLIYSKEWPTKINIEGDGVEDELMIAKTVGNQEGLGIMGFCYAPYHFVYDINFPVLIQIYDENELFQFPVVVVIDKNMPREGIYSGIEDFTEDFNLCQYKMQDIQVNLYNNELNSVDGKISYSCLDQECDIGETENGVFVGKAPSCVNGFLKVESENYAEKKQLFSSNSETISDIVLDRKYKENVKLYLSGKEFKSGNAIIVFSRENGTKTTSIIYPEIKEVELTEGGYEVKVYVYGNSSITLPESKKTQCTEVSKSGVAGFFGGTKEECFDITIPATKVEYALIGGGNLQTYLLPSELEKGNLNVMADEMSLPKTIEELQNNFILFEQKEVSLEFV